MIVTCNHRTAFDVLPFHTVGPLDVLVDRALYVEGGMGSMLAHYFLKAFGAVALPTATTDEGSDGFCGIVRVLSGFVCVQRR